MRLPPREPIARGFYPPADLRRPGAVVFFGRHKLRESTGWMGAFWASVAGKRSREPNAPAQPPGNVAGHWVLAAAQLRT